MFDTAFNEPKMRRTLLAAGDPVRSVRVRGASKPMKTFLAEDLTYDFYPSRRDSGEGGSPLGNTSAANSAR